MDIFPIDCLVSILLPTRQFDDQELEQFDDEFSDFGEFDNTMQTEDFPDSLRHSLPPGVPPLDLEAIRAEHNQLPDFDDVDSGVYFYVCVCHCYVVYYLRKLFLVSCIVKLCLHKFNASRVLSWALEPFRSVIRNTIICSLKRILIPIYLFSEWLSRL